MMTDPEFHRERIWRICKSCARYIYGTTPPNDRYADATAHLLFGTAAQESGLKWERQRTPRWDGDLGGFSKWQVERGSIVHGVEHLARNLNLRMRCTEWLFMDPKARPDFIARFPHGPICEDENRILWAMRLDDNDKIGCLFARLHYIRVPEPIPDTIPDQARYWKRYYNTVAGKGTVDEYVDNWARLCQPTIDLTCTPPVQKAGGRCHPAPPPATPLSSAQNTKEE